MTPIEILRVANVLGEGVLWNHRSGTLWWTDIQTCRLFSYHWESKALRHFSTPERLCSFGFVADSHQLIAAFESGLALYEPETQAMEWLARPEARAGLRFNDGRVDRQGRFWAGTMVENAADERSAHLYCLDCTGRAQPQASDIRISNGLCFSPDGARLYFADSPRHTIHAYELQEPEGSVQNRRLFVQTPEGAQPDGANVDAEGCVWSAHWGAGQVVRYTPDGRVSRVLSIPATQPTCVAFGGPHLDLLFVSSAREGLSDAALQYQPDAGGVFVYEAGVKGLPEPQYRYTPRALSSAAQVQK